MNNTEVIVALVGVVVVFGGLVGGAYLLFRLENK